ncbi:MAG: hypothetical protein WC661_03280 [Opitutaceae bacterium]|jgi:hypothetical protein
MTSDSPNQAHCVGFDRAAWRHPPAAFSQCPFWFWNDDLTEAELVRQIADFQAHGVEAFVIHARIGLPRSCGWLSDELFRFMRIALTEARRRGMWAMLYDEGMYPSGAASGLVVARDASFQTRGLVCGPASEQGAVNADRKQVAVVTRKSGERVGIYEQKIDAVVRGLHYIGDENDPTVTLGEEEPPAADLLNPRAVECFIELVYDRFYQELGEFFGNTVKAIFTDEPHPLSRSRNPDTRPGTAEVLAYVNRHLGHDFTPHLSALWFDDEPDAAKHRRDYAEAVAARLDETYYAPLSRWCERHGIALTGHPAEPDDIGHLKHLHIPGQDIVWRHIEPGKASALEGPPSTMAKAAASVAFHRGRSRNLNEFAGAYGQELTFDELRWLASWLLIRGCDLLVPHAFYYSMRGPRRYERPPDVGPNNTWWPEYRAWADMTRRLCWLNATFTPVCDVAILGRATELPWRAAKACYERQVDFHYVEPADLAQATVKDGKLCVGPGCYLLLIVEEGYEVALPPDVPVLRWPASGVGELLSRVSPAVDIDQPAPSIRARRLRGEGVEMFLLFNEGADEVTRKLHFPSAGQVTRLDPGTGRIMPWDSVSALSLPAHGWAVFESSKNAH